MKWRLLLAIVIVTVSVYSQKIDAVVFFKDGTTKVGFVKYGPKPLQPGIWVNDTFKFRPSRESKEITEYRYSEITKMEIIEGDDIRTIYFKISRENPKLLVEVSQESEGTVSIFLNRNKTHGPPINAPLNVANNSNISFGIGLTVGGRISSKWYVQKEGEFMVHIYPKGLMGGSDKAILEYFSDCPKLIEYIKNDTFWNYVKNHPDYKKKSKSEARIREIVKYYNENCAAPPSDMSITP